MFELGFGNYVLARNDGADWPSLDIYLLPSLIFNSAFKSVPVWRRNFIKCCLHVYSTLIFKSSENLKNCLLLSDLTRSIDDGKAYLEISMTELGPAVGQS